MVKKIKSFICCMLTVCLFVTAAVIPQSVSAAETAVRFPITVTEDYNELHDLLGLINNARKEKGLPPFTLDAGLTDYAMQRSCESTIQFAHERPDGQPLESAVSGGVFAENIAQGQQSALSVFLDWSVSEGHYRTMMHSGNLYCGIGCIKYKGCYFWTLILAEEGVKTDYKILSSGSRQANRTLEVLPSFLKSKCMFSRWPQTVQYGDTKGDGQNFKIMANSAKNGNVNYEPPANMLSFSVRDPKILQIDPNSGKLLPRGIGRTKVTVTLKGTTFSSDVEIEVWGTTSDTTANTSKPVTTTPGKVKLRSIRAVNNNRIQINWNKTSGATHYRIYYKTPGGSWKQIATTGANTTSYTHVSSSKFPIKCGQKYTYTVRGYNSSSRKAGSYDSKGLTTRTLPTTVSLRSARRNANNTVTVSWNKAYGGNYYRVYRKTPGSGWKLIATVRSSSLTYTDRKPVKGKKNTYTVRMYNSSTKVAGKYNTRGVSVNIGNSNVTPGKVKLKSIKAVNNNRIRISWNKTGGATHYRIYYKIPGGSWKYVKTVGGNATSFTHVSSTKSPIICGQKYIYTVRGYNSESGKAGKYDTRGLTTRTVPRTVTLKSARQNSDHSVTVSWNRSYGGNYYRIYRKTSGSRWKLIATVKSSSLRYVDRNPVKGKKNTYTVRMYNSVKRVAGGYRTKGVSVNVKR